MQCQAPSCTPVIRLQVMRGKDSWQGRKGATDDSTLTSPAKSHCHEAPPGPWLPYTPSGSDTSTGTGPFRTEGPHQAQRRSGPPLACAHKKTPFHEALGCVYTPTTTTT